MTGAVETVIYYQGGQTGRAFVARAKRVGRKVKSVVVDRLDNSELFPTACGDYLMGARTLPGSTKIAMLYGSDVIRLVDPRNGTVLSITDHRDPDMASTCQGYSANAEAGRGKNERNPIAVVPAKREIQFVYSNWKKIVQ